MKRGGRSQNSRRDLSGIVPHARASRTTHSRSSSTDAYHCVNRRIASASIAVMNGVLADLLRGNQDVVTRQQALTLVADHVIEYALEAGCITQLLPRVYVTAEKASETRVRHRAALLYAGEDAMLSHMTALPYWSLPMPSTSIVHVTVPRHVCRYSRPGILTVHRAANRFSSVGRGEARVSRLERAVVDSWPLLAEAEQRAPAILAVAERRTTARRLLAEAQGRSNLPGRASLWPWRLRVAARVLAAQHAAAVAEHGASSSLSRRPRCYGSLLRTKGSLRHCGRIAWDPFCGYVIASFRSDQADDADAANNRPSKTCRASTT